jgi:hypothetical protein
MKDVINKSTKVSLSPIVIPTQEGIQSFQYVPAPRSPPARGGRLRRKDKMNAGMTFR